MYKRLGRKTIVGCILVSLTTFFMWMYLNDDRERVILGPDKPRDSGREPRPHVIFILADDYGYNDIGYHNEHMKTPTLDSLARNGVTLENYYVQPICSPTRSQLMSGRYQIHTGLQHSVIWPWQANGLPTDSPTLADKMKEAGYATHMVGKWHLGFYKSEYLPWKRGFDTFYGFLTGGGYYFEHTSRYVDGKHYYDFRDQDGVLYSAKGQYSTHLFTDRAVNIIRDHDEEKPLFMYLSYQAVHGPMQVPEKYSRKFRHIKNRTRRIYAGMVAAMDESVRNVTQALKDYGLWDNSLIIFSSDNGGDMDHGGNNYPLRGRKASLWEGAMRAVGFLSGGRVAEKIRGTVNRELLHVSDWFPTLVNLAGGNLNGTKPLDGLDQWGTLAHGYRSQRKVLLHNIDELTPKIGSRLFEDTFDTRVSAAIRVGDLKLITGDPGEGRWVPPPEVNGQNKELQEPKSKNVWLFNITEDPREENDLSDSRPGAVRYILDQLYVINKTAVPAIYPPPDPKCDPKRHDGIWEPWE